MGIVLELADGGDLTRHLEAPLSEAHALTWFTQVMLGLANMHYKGLLHRDIKPGNILICSLAAGGLAKLGDFGLVRRADTLHMTIGVGTYMFIAPEMLDNIIEEKSDVWAMGLVLFMMLSGGYEFPYTFDWERNTYKDYLKQVKERTLPRN